MEFRYLGRANKTSEWMWATYLKYLAVILPSLAITPLFSVLYCYLSRADFDVNQFYRPGKFV